jgi:hypothetical protein
MDELRDELLDDRDAATAATGASLEPSPPVADAAPLPAPPPSPFAVLSPRPTRVVGRAFDVLTHASADLRRASFYIGLIVLALATPFAILVWRLTLEEIPVVLPGVEAAYSVLVVVALCGVIVATIESRAVAVSLLAARLAGRSPDLRAAVQRSRTVFWRLLAAIALTNVPLFVVQSFVGDRMAALLGGESEPSIIGAAIVSAVLFSPVAYVVTGVVVGDVGPWIAVRRSVRLFRAAKVTAVVVALFEFGAQLLVAFGLAAGLDLVIRGVDAIGVDATNELGSAITIALIVVLLFATGSLLFTVAAVAIAPQVVAFVALTHSAPGIERPGVAAAASTSFPAIAGGMASF